MGPFDQCKYWSLFKIDDHQGWNDDRIISFEPAKGCVVNKLDETFVATLRELGNTLARSVVIGGKGAYSVNAEEFKYYLVEWTADPCMIDEDGVIMVVNQPMQVFTGDWVCDGKWLNPVHGAKFWYTVEDIEVMVRMQNILNPNLSMSVISTDNPLPRMSNAVVEGITQKHPIKLNAYDLNFMMDEISQRQM